MKAFVGFPYRFGPAYRDAIRAALADVGIEALFADDRFTGSHIWDNIEEVMSEANFAIFDITGLNPNVLIEIGYAYGLDYVTVIMLNPERHLRDLGIEQQNIPLPIPEDLAGFQRVHYTDMTDIKQQLAQALKTIKDQIGEGTDPIQEEALRLLESGSKKLSEIVAHVQSKIDDDFSYQVIRLRMEDLVRNGTVKKNYDGRQVVYTAN